MMNYALFLGCQIPVHLKQYEASTRAVSERLGLGLVDVEAFKCCGYPLRNIDFKTFLLSSARNLALAEQEKLNVMALCQCCYGALKKADVLLKENLPLRKEINSVLEQESLLYRGEIEVKHLLTVLDQDIGVEAIGKKIEKPLQALKIAAHYGCHALRPSQIVKLDDPGAPSIFERLVKVTGAESIDWLMRLECCGAPLLGTHDELSEEMTIKKVKNGRESGADYLCTACTYCQIQFDTVQQRRLSERGFNPPLPSLLYPQLLGLSMGISPETLGLKRNKIRIREIGS